MTIFSVNNTNSSFKILDVNTNQQIGTLYPKEVCGQAQGEAAGYGAIHFLSSKGVLESGKLSVIDPDDFSKLTPLYDLPYSRESIDGVEYNIYKMRRAMPVYTAAATRWGSVAANMYVAAGFCNTGDYHLDWMQIYYVKSTSGQWVKVTGDGRDYGFVDTGLASASGYNTWAIQGRSI